MEISDAFATLKEHFGNHSLAAAHLGITPEHYRALRNGRAHIKKSTADLIILKAMTAAQDTPDPAPANVESVSQPRQVVTG